MTVLKLVTFSYRKPSESSDQLSQLCTHMVQLPFGYLGFYIKPEPYVIKTFLKYDVLKSTGSKYVEKIKSFVRIYFMLKGPQKCLHVRNLFPINN
jgi:hypothetical protein